MLKGGGGGGGGGGGFQCPKMSKCLNANFEKQKLDTKIGHKNWTVLDNFDFKITRKLNIQEGFECPKMLNFCCCPISIWRPHCPCEALEQ